MSDLISREAVLGLKTIAPIAPVINGEDVHYEEVIFVRDLEKLPSVEPEKCGDCINRKDMLKKLNNLCNNTCDYSEIQRKSMCDACNLSLVFDMINNAKSVEPEKCGDCMTVEAYRTKLIDAFHKADHDELIALVALPTEKDFEHLEWLLKTHYENRKKCGDCISRQAVLEVQAKYAEHMGATKFWQMRDDIKALQPVTPQPKTGHWVMKHKTHNAVKRYTGQDEMGETHTISVLERYEADEPYCSECGKLAGDTSQDYCCACGAKMEV